MARSASLARAIDLLGGVSKLAASCGVRSQAVSQWERVPARHVLTIERATGGEVTRHQLRPDLYPDPQGAAA